MSRIDRCLWLQHSDDDGIFLMDDRAGSYVVMQNINHG